MNCFFPGCASGQNAESVYCEYHLHSFVKGKQCHAPDASDEKKKSSAIGEPLPDGLSLAGVLTRLLENSEKLIWEMQHRKAEINELTRGMEYLAQQVKTLVDALAEDADPDQPITTYLSGKPV